MIGGLKGNLFEVTDQMLGDLLSLLSSRESNLLYIQQSHTHQKLKMLKSTKASMEEEMSEYDRERRLVREREGIEFATDVQEAARASVFESLDTVHRNPLQVSMPACMFSSSTA